MRRWVFIIRKHFFLLLLVLAFGSTGTALASPTITAGPSHPLAADFLGLNIEAPNKNNFPWNDRLVAYWLQRFHVKMARLPGGAVGNYWDWPSGSPCADRKNGGKTLSAFENLFDAAGIKPLFVFNVMSYVANNACNIAPVPANEAAKMSSQFRALRAARQLGLPILDAELGNEFYLAKSDYVTTFPCTRPDCQAGDYNKADDNAGAVYASDMNNWIASLHAFSADLKIGVVVMARAGNNFRQKNWNAGVFGTIDGSAAGIFHNYDFLDDPNLLGYPAIAQMFEDWSQMQTNLAPIYGAGLHHAWVTEWNYDDKTPNQVFSGSWAGAMMNFQHQINYLSDSLITRSVPWPLTYPPKGSSFVYFPDQTYDIGGVSYTIHGNSRGVLSANGYALSLANAAVEGATRATELNFSDDPMINGSGFTAFASLTGVEAAGLTRSCLLLENYLNDPQKITVPALPAGTVFVSYSAPSLSTYITPNNPPATISTEISGTTIVLPAYSINTACTPVIAVHENMRTQ